MTRVCPVCKGEGEIKKNPGWPDPQAETWLLCRRCWGTGVIKAGEVRHAA